MPRSFCQASNFGIPCIFSNWHVDAPKRKGVNHLHTNDGFPMQCLNIRGCPSEKKDRHSHLNPLLSSKLGLYHVLSPHNWRLHTHCFSRGHNTTTSHGLKSQGITKNFEGFHHVHAISPLFWWLGNVSREPLEIPLSHPVIPVGRKRFPYYGLSQSPTRSTSSLVQLYHMLS